MSDDPIVTVGGWELSTVKNLALTRKHDAPGGDLSLSLADPGAAGQGWTAGEAARRRQALRDALELDGQIRVLWQGELLFTGALEHVSYQLNNGGTKIALRARSLGKGLEEAAVPGTAFGADMPIEAALNGLVQPHGLSVGLAAGVESGMKLGAFVPRHGERLLPELLRLCRTRGLTLRERADGNMELARASYGGDVPVLRSGESPVKDASVEFDVTRRSGKVKAHGQRRQSVGHDPETATRAAEQLQDLGMTRERTIELLTAGLGDIDTTATLADVVRRARVRDSLRVRVEVAGWSARIKGPAWQAGDLLCLQAPELDIDRTLLMNSVSLNWSTSGHDASLSLAPLEGYDVPATGQAALNLPKQAAAPASQGGTNATLVDSVRALTRGHATINAIRQQVG